LSDSRPDISVVVPAFNEYESLPELVERIDKSVQGMSRSCEIWIIDDGSSDSTFEVVEQLSQKYDFVHGISFARNYGKAAALAAGFSEVTGEIVITMDADLQDDPAEIPALVAKIESGYDLVSGWKKDRKDSFIKNNTSKIFNFVTSKSIGLRLHDFNCGLKAYRYEVTQTVRLYGEMHRYIPAQAHRNGFKVTEIPVKHCARIHGETKYGSSRFVNGFLDLLTMLFLSARGTSPLHMFGRIGVAFLVPGMLINIYFLFYWLMGNGLHIRPILLLAEVFLLMAVQFISLGLLAELVVAGRNPEREYIVRKQI
jgi:glycosyltransferase involved in cell wall biosynthesis